MSRAEAADLYNCPESSGLSIVQGLISQSWFCEDIGNSIECSVLVAVGYRSRPLEGVLVTVSVTLHLLG